MFAVFAVTLQESSAASLYDMYVVEGEPHCWGLQLIWCDLVTLFTRGQAGKASQQSNRKCSKTLSKAPCLVALRMYLTLHLLLFWTIKTINVRLD